MQTGELFRPSPEPSGEAIRRACRSPDRLTSEYRLTSRWSLGHVLAAFPLDGNLNAVPKHGLDVTLLALPRHSGNGWTLPLSSPVRSSGQSIRAARCGPRGSRIDLLPTSSRLCDTRRVRR